MIRSLVRLAALSAFALPGAAGLAAAQGIFVGPPPSVVDAQPLEGKRGRVARELDYLGVGGGDVARLSNQTIARLDNAIHGGGSQSYKQARVRSILSGGGILQRTIERVDGRR